MPEFILDHGSDEGYKWYVSLDSFTQGYVEAMFFTDTGDPDDAEDGLEDASVSDLAPSTCKEIEADCKAWQDKHAGLLALAYDQEGYDEEAAGRDYWYTRNGHGVGFWDRKPLDEPKEYDGAMVHLGDALSEAAGRRECYVYRGDDGLIYVD